MADERTIRGDDLDGGFAAQVRAEPGGEQIDLCISCGRCTAVCPVQRENPDLNPCRVVRMAVLGLAREVLESDFVWLCAGCYACRETCPQGIRVTDLMVVLRNMAVQRGIIHPSYRVQIAELSRYGRLYEVEPFNKKRAKLELPGLEDRPSDVASIFASTGIDSLGEGGA